MILYIFIIDQIGKGRTWKTGEFEHPLGRCVNFQVEVKGIDPLLERIRRSRIALFSEVEEKLYRKNKRGW